MSEDPVNILLVDDQPGKLLTYESVLGELGENLIKVGSAREALDFLLRNEVAVMLVDVQMPELDGFELAAMIREHPRYRRVAMIFVSAFHMNDVDRLRGYQLGAVDFVSVPIVPEILRAKVAVFVDLYRKTQQLEVLNRDLEVRVAERTAELRAAAMEVRASEERLNLALDSAGAASWDWNAITNRLDWSPRFRQLHGLADSNPPTLQTMIDHVQEGDRERLIDRIHSMLATPGDDEWNELFRIMHPRRGLREIRRLGRAFRDEAGCVVRMRGIDLDVTERLGAERALEAADRRKDQFLATLSHELRNPLTPILNAVQILAMPQASEGRRARARGIIDRQARRIARVIEDLLDLSRIARGVIALERAPVRLQQVITRALEHCGPRLDERNLLVSVTAADGDLVVDGDLGRLAQALTNLLDNAAKSSDRGGHVDVHTRRDGDEAVLSVCDTGIGIDEELLPRVFELFPSASRVSEGAGGGLGIELPIVQELVRLHGGTVIASSAGKGRGSEFVVRLPLHDCGACRDSPCDPG